MADPIKTFETYKASSDFTFLVYYRGHWCPFCMNYLSQLQAISSKVTAAGGTTVAVTAEAESELSSTRAASGYTGNLIVDPANKLVRELKARGLLDVAISAGKKGYEHGMAQPAVLVLKKDGTVLYDWAIVPSLMNFGGAKDRPSLAEIWDNVNAGLMGQPPVHKTYNRLGAAQLLMSKIGF